MSAGWMRITSCRPSLSSRSSGYASIRCCYRCVTLSPSWSEDQNADRAQQLAKTTDPGATHYQELLDGVESIKRVTEKVNETKRQQENALAVQELDRRVEDWKGHDIRNFGSLLLEDTFMVFKSESEREYHVYLFERIILCCKEVGNGGGKKGSKSNSILKKPVSKRSTKLQLKGRIFIANVQSARPLYRDSSSGALPLFVFVWSSWIETTHRWADILHAAGHLARRHGRRVVHHQMSDAGDGDAMATRDQSSGRRGYRDSTGTIRYLVIEHTTRHHFTPFRLSQYTRL